MRKKIDPARQIAQVMYLRSFFGAQRKVSQRVEKKYPYIVFYRHEKTPPISANGLYNGQTRGGAAEPIKP